jgi:lambda family phage portal protein
MNSGVKRILKYFGITIGQPAAPARAAGRGNYLRRTYQGGIPTNLTADWSIAQTSANQELRRSLRNLRARSRELARNKGVMKKFLSMIAANVVGPNGIVLRVTFDPHGNSTPERDLQLSQEIEAAFKEWSKPENCSASGNMSFAGQQWFAVRSMARDGEFLCREIAADNPFGYALQFRDPAWLDETYNQVLPNGNRVLMSVELDDVDRPVTYWLTRPASDYLYPEYDPHNPRRRTPFPASEIIHKFLVTEDEAQTRGVPWAHAAMDDIHILGGLVDAELVASRAGACVTDYFLPPENEDQGDAGEDLPSEFQVGAVRELEPGVAQILPAGWKVESNDPKHPNTNISAFVKEVKRDIASALEVSFESLANDRENVNYSSIRAGLLDERDSWRMLQAFMTQHFCHRVFQNWLKAAMLSGAVTLSLRDFERVRDNWRPRGWDWVDPLKDVQAAILAIMNGLESRTDYCDERGDDFADNIVKLAGEQAAMEAAGLPVNLSAVKPAKPIPAKTEGEPGDQPAETDQTEGDGESGDGPQRVMSIFESQLLPTASAAPQ